MADPSGAADANRDPSISFRFLQEEDRIRIQVDEFDGRVMLFDLTRRLTGPLINALADILETSNPMLARTPTEMQAQAMEMAHQASASNTMAKENAPAVDLDDLVKDDESPEEPEAASPPAVPGHKTRLCPPLVKTVHFVKQESGDHHLVLEDLDGVRTGLRTSNDLLHGMLQILVNKSEQASWRLGLSKSWAQAKRAEPEVPATRN